MKTRALAVLLPLLALAACTEDNGVSIQPFKLCAPPTDSCTFEAVCEFQYIGINIMDVGLTRTYWSFIEVHNNLASNEDLSAGRPNTHDAYVESYTVDYEVPGATAPASVTRTVAAGPTMVPASGTAVVSVLPIPPDVGAQIAGGTSVLAKVRLRGFLSDQSTWETAEYPIPIEVCSGCLGSAPTCADPAQTLVACPGVGQRPTSVFCE